MIVGGAIATYASAAPLQSAIFFDGETINWLALETLLRKLANWLATQAPSNAPVAIHLPNSPALAAIFLATIRMGREAQILDTQWPQQASERLLDELKPALVITLESELACRAKIVLTHDQLSFSGLSQLMGPIAALEEWPEVDAEKDFYTGFTSGSTGLPKGYRRNHRSWVRSIAAAQTQFALDERSVILAPGTLTHSLFLFALAYAMQIGATCILSRTFRPDHLAEIARTQKADVLFSVPAQLTLLSKQSANCEPAFSLRHVISSGSKWRGRDDPGLRKLFPVAKFSEFYGASETSFISIAHEGDAIPVDSVGRAFDGVDISIRDQSGTLLPPGAAGRIFVASAMIFTEYATADGIIERDNNCAIAVGDIGYIDEAGCLYVTGRENRMIVTSEKNLFPEEVEAVLALHESIQAVAVIGAPDDKRGERVLAIIKPANAAGVKRAALIKHARRHLPLFKIPRHFFIANDWPTTRSGKTDFQKLAALWREGLLEPLS